MKILLNIFLGLLVAADLSSTQKVRYDNYKLLNIVPQSEEHIKLLGILENSQGVDIWNDIKGIGDSVHVLFSPSNFQEYKPLLDQVAIPYTVDSENVQEKFDEQEQEMAINKREITSGVVGRFARYAQIMNYIDEMVRDNPDIASSYNAGTSFEKRDLKVAVLKTPSSRKNVWIDCGIHAREWVAVSSCVWFIDRLVQEYRNNDTITVNLLKTYEFHILPIVNPDGYEYTFTTNRLWRKNKQPSKFSSCFGVDLNRNFNFKWMVSGTTNFPCTDTYGGPSPDSEPETRAVENAIISHPGKFESFFTIHSYGGFWMPPWGYTSELPADYDELERISRIATNAIKAVDGTNFKIGPPHKTVQYSASGGSYDWAKGVQNVKYAYALELRPAEGSSEYNYGFALPEYRAPIACKETYAGLKAAINEIYRITA